LKEEKSFEKCRKFIISGQCSMKRGKCFLLNLTIHGFGSLYGAKKIFHSIVGSNGIARVVRV